MLVKPSKRTIEQNFFGCKNNQKEIIWEEVWIVGIGANGALVPPLIATIVLTSAKSLPLTQETPKEYFYSTPWAKLGSSLQVEILSICPSVCASVITSFSFPFSDSKLRRVTQPLPLYPMSPIHVSHDPPHSPVNWSPNEQDHIVDLSSPIWSNDHSNITSDTILWHFGHGHGGHGHGRLGQRWIFFQLNIY